MLSDLNTPLWPSTLAATAHGLACGALQPIATTHECVADGGIPFVVRIAANLVRKERAAAVRQTAKGEDFNPFLPYDPDLFVADLSPTHVCILNKFNVVDHHLLMVTREFEDQATALTAQDFEAMWQVLREIDGLAFYNGGKGAGASQKHKHLQLVPLPSNHASKGLQNEPRLPLEAVFDFRELQVGCPDSLAALPFAHSLVRLDPAWAKDPTQAGAETKALYDQLLRAVALSPEPPCADDSPAHNLPAHLPANTPVHNPVHYPAGAYNLLATRNWLLVVPRQAEACAGISVNALGFAGSFFVKDLDQLMQLRAIGPLSILKAVAR